MFNVLAITETSESDTTSFVSNVSMHPTFNLYSTPTNSAKGGTALYIDSNLESFERVDLKCQNNEFEATWAEIANSDGKNILCRCVYHHPTYDYEEFLLYLENTLRLVSKEKKRSLYLW